MDIALYILGCSMSFMFGMMIGFWRGIDYARERD